MPKIFIVVDELHSEDGIWTGFALAEDGTGLVEHMSTSKFWIRHDMGLTSKNHHAEYEAHYPDGYELVDYVDKTDAELREDAEYMKASRGNHDEVPPAH